ncbi:MAG: thiol reductant ABC exporter subunit CydC [Desulfobacteraceae bacterium]|jgi:ATP-binding cassette subfamily C protein CydC
MNPEPGRKPSIFMGMIRHHWPSMALGGILSLLAALAAISLFSLSGWFIAATAYAGLNVTTAKAFNFFLPSIGVRLFAMMRTGARYADRLVSHDATFRMLETLRTWYYKRLEPLAPARLAQHHSGDLLTRIITDIDTLDNLYLRVLSPSAVAVAVVALLVGFIGYVQPWIALYSGGLLVAAGVGIPFFADYAGRSAANQLNVRTARLRTTLVDGIHGLAAILTCGAQTRHMAQVRRRHCDLVRSQEKMSHVTGITHAMMGLLSGLAVVGTLFIGVGAVADGTLSGPYLVLLVLSVMAGFEVVAPLPNAYQYLGQTRKATGRLREVTQVPPAVTFPAASPQASQNCQQDNQIEFDEVSFKYTPTDPYALKNISFTIPSRNRTAIMGATGSGKSTLLYLLSRFDNPSSGNIRLGRCRLDAFPERSLRQSICIVDQKAHIFNGTVRDNLLLAAPEADDTTLMEALSAVELTDFVNHLPKGLRTWVGEAGRLLSGGQARRLAIARAVLSSAPIWAFDEPTEGLDTATAQAMMTNLISHGRDKTVIMITHRPEAIEQMDQVILLESGRIAAVGSPASLRKHSALYDRLISSRQP